MSASSLSSARLHHPHHLSQSALRRIAHRCQHCKLLSGVNSHMKPHQPVRQQVRLRRVCVSRSPWSSWAPRPSKRASLPPARLPPPRTATRAQVAAGGRTLEFLVGYHYKQYRGQEEMGSRIVTEIFAHAKWKPNIYQSRESLNQGSGRLLPTRHQDDDDYGGNGSNPHD
ncbi:hypothetical protein MAPG_07877 [Magnaporthiopsis poae ATCC 64411]|uniref:Uncharacterized protein n=1 Tax=Magnaporthiopsis poae (strain ATCC 64411 / 73-15) TaxID=644358 RepID=A0A0C4E5V2_MAGP6|nr:hypothetical protein MAPG_07877 [Magnaporthiopsis poae ATCC 64411]